MSSVLAQAVLSGLLTGGVYAMVSVGLTLIFGVMRIINFAHGDFVMLGMYAAVGLSAAFALDPYVSVAIIGPGFFALGIAVHQIIIRPLVHRGAPHTSQALATLGLSVVVVSAVLLTASGRSVIATTSLTTSVLNLGALVLSVTRMVAFAVALVTTGLLYLFLHHTYPGMAIRATAQDRKAAVLLGLPTERADAMTFGLGIACAAIAGSVMVPFFYVNPFVGQPLGLVAYIVVVLGGMGSMLGALLGGLAIGVIEALSGYLLDPGLKELVYLLLFVAVLIVMPSGLFGVRGAERMAE